MKLQYNNIGQYNNIYIDYDKITNYVKYTFFINLHCSTWYSLAAIMYILPFCFIIFFFFFATTALDIRNDASTRIIHSMQRFRLKFYIDGNNICIGVV